MSKITKKSREYMEEAADELANNVTVALNNTVVRMRREQPAVTDNIRYSAQYLLEELIANLQKRV